MTAGTNWRGESAERCYNCGGTETRPVDTYTRECEHCGEYAITPPKVPPPPKWAIVKVPEREHWHQEIQAQTTAIWGVYAIDLNLYVYICSREPTYEAHYLGPDYAEIDGLSEEAREELNGRVIEGASENQPVDYFGARTIERIVENEPDLWRLVDWPLEPDEDPTGQIMEAWNTGSAAF